MTFTRKQLLAACGDASANTESERLLFCGKPMNGKPAAGADMQVGCISFGAFNPSHVCGRPKGGCSGQANPIPAIRRELAAGRIVDVRIMDGYAAVLMPQ
jgi:hypothetical protein